MNESILNAIKKIGEKYNFLSWYDLPQALSEGVKYHHAITALYKNSPSNKELRDKLKKLIKIKKMLVTELNSTPDEVKDYVNIFLNCIFSIAKYSAKESWGFSKHQFRSELTLSAFELAIAEMPHQKGGKKPTSVRQDIIEMLVDVFREGTGTDPECKHNGYNNTYSGLVYDFILDIEPLLEKLNIENLGNDESIGKSIILSIKEHKKIPKNKLLVPPS